MLPALRPALLIFCGFISIAAFRDPLQCSGQATSATAHPAASGEHRLLVLYRNGAIPGDAEGQAARLGGHLLRRQDRLGTALVSASPAMEASLRKDPDVESVIEDRLLSASSIAVGSSETTRPISPIRPNPGSPLMSMSVDPTDTFYNGSPQGWAVRAVGGFGGGIAGSAADGPWATTTGTGVRIAVLDSGVDRTHPDIAPNLVLNMTEVDQTAQPSPCEDGSPQDQSGHGTWVASLAAGAAGASTGRVVGVAPNASILNIKVLQRMPGTGSTLPQQCSNGQAAGLLSWVLQGINDAMEQHADIVVLSMSVTLDLYNGEDAGVKASFDRVTHAASQAGVILVAAAGNDAFDLSNTRYVEMPAQARDVLAVVASTNPYCAQNLSAGASCAVGPVSLPYYSNFGAPLNAVAAPGGSYPLGTDEGISGWVRGACTSGLPNTVDGLPTDANHSEGCFNTGHAQYVQAIGTSASAPLVAGVVALVKTAHPDWTAATILAAVRASALPTATMPYGVVNAAAAIAYQPQ